MLLILRSIINMGIKLIIESLHGSDEFGIVVGDFVSGSL